MGRFAGGLFAMLVALSGCATGESGPLLSPATVGRIADAQLRQVKKIDSRQYQISEPHYNPKDGYWSVTYCRKPNKRVAFTVRVSDKMQETSINESNAGVFEGSLTEKPDNH